MNAKGFTLIELVIVLIVLGILSVTVVPKFFSSNGFSEYTYRTDIIAKLRLIQTRAMQQANLPVPAKKYCHRVVLGATQLSKGTCLPAIEYLEQSEQRATSVTIATDDRVTFSPAGLTFRFDNMGRPIIDDNKEKIEIIITGEQALTVTIESEGYIHAS